MVVWVAAATAAPCCRHGAATHLDQGLLMRNCKPSLDSYWFFSCCLYWSSGPVVQWSSGLVVY